MSYQADNPSVFHQKIHEESATAKHEIGTVRTLSDGRVFQYAKAGAVALVAGTLNQSVVPDAGDDEISLTAATIGSTTVVGTATATADEFAGGYLVLNKGTDLGQTYRIRGNTAATAAAITFTLEDPLRVAVTDEEATFVRHPQDGVIIHPSPATASLAGVAPMAVTASYYFWNQVRGIAGVLTEGTVVIAEPVRASETTDGAVAAVDYDEADKNNPLVGTVLEVGITAEVSVINLCLA